MIYNRDSGLTCAAAEVYSSVSIPLQQFLLPSSKAYKQSTPYKANQTPINANLESSLCTFVIRFAVLSSQTPYWPRQYRKHAARKACCDRVSQPVLRPQPTDSISSDTHQLANNCFVAANHCKVGLYAPIRTPNRMLLVDQHHQLRNLSLCSSQTRHR